MIKKLELTDPKSCMSKADDNEMTFVLLGRDETAPDVIRFWIAERIRRGKNYAGDAQVTEAEECAKAMERQFGICVHCGARIVWDDYSYVHKKNWLASCHTGNTVAEPPALLPPSPGAVEAGGEEGGGEGA